MSAATNPFTASPSVPLLPVPATTKRPHSAVSARLATTVKDDDDFNQRQKVGSIGRAVLTASSNPKSQTPTPKSNTKEVQQQQLSGSDVLSALSRATAEKAKKKKRNNLTNSSPGIAREGKISKEIGTKKVVDVKPLCVKEEWGIRLQELQDRLDELRINIM